jgi:hypothetical protein
MQALIIDLKRGQGTETEEKRKEEREGIRDQRSEVGGQRSGGRGRGSGTREQGQTKNLPELKKNDLFSLLLAIFEIIFILRYW